MQRFTFPLEAVLRLRRQRVEEAEAELGRRQRELAAIHAEQSELLRSVREAESTPTDAESSGERWQQLDRYRRRAGERRILLAGAATACLDRIAAQQREVLAARRDEELVLRLKQKRRVRWEQEADREQQALAEEAYMSQWARLAQKGKKPSS